MTSGYVWLRHQAASYSEVVALLKELTGDWAISAFHYQERLDAVELGKASPAWGKSLEQPPTTFSPHGRLFCNQFELRWQAAEVQAEAYEIRVIAEEPLSWPDAAWSRAEFEVGADYSTYLWGERKENDSAWTATRIPRAQAYPVQWAADKTRTALWVRDYRQNGLTRLTRMLRVEAVVNPEE